MITITTSDTWTKIPSDNRIFGNFIESGFGRQVNGMWSEMIYNRAFRQITPYLSATWEWLGIDESMYNDSAPFWHSGYEEFDWQPIGSPILGYTIGSRTYKGMTTRRVKNTTPGRCGLSQKGIHLHQGESYHLRLFAGVEGRLSQAGLAGFGITEHTDAEYPLIVRIGKFQTEFLLTTTSKAFDWLFVADQDEVVDVSLTFYWEGELMVSSISLMSESNLQGWRKDVVESLRQVAPPVVRFPGGCFVSFYDWESSIGDRGTREPMPSYYWGGLEENDVGLDEFLSLASLVGFEPQICFNMMTSTPFKARQLVEYLNAPSSTGMGRLRMQNGHTEPYGVKLFEMDNEPGRKWTAKQYAENCQLFSQEMRLADPGIELMMAAYSYPVETLPGMLKIAGKHIDYAIYRQGMPEFVGKVLPVIREYNAENGTSLRLVNTEWLPPCQSIEPFENPEIPTDFRWRGVIPNDYSKIFSTQQRSWNYALNGAKRLLNYMSYGGEFALANFNNMCNTWGQNVIEATKDTCYLSNMGKVFSFFRRNFEPCTACDTLTGDERVSAQLTKGADGRLTLYAVNHSSSPLSVTLPVGEWAFVEGIAADNRLSYANETSESVYSCTADIENSTMELPPLSLVCLQQITKGKETSQ